MADYIKKFANPALADQYAIKDIPFITSVATDPIQNLHCNLSGKKLVNVSGIVRISSSVTPPEMVDLGLTSGTLWAKYNLGANPGNTPESYYGDYYAWGELETKENYTWATYKYCTEDYDPLEGIGSLLKYNSTDNKTVLDPEDDIATQTYGNGYEMPSSIDLQELVEETDFEWITNYNGIIGLNGCKFMKKLDHNIYIFIPANGYFDGLSILYNGECCQIFSQTINEGSRQSAIYLYVDNEYEISIFGTYRYTGMSIRPVQHVS